MFKLHRLSDKPYFLRMLIILCLFVGAAGVMGAVVGNVGAIGASPLLFIGYVIWKASDEAEDKKAREAQQADAARGTSGAQRGVITPDMLDQLISSDGTYHTPRALQDTARYNSKDNY